MAKEIKNTPSGKNMQVAKSGRGWMSRRKALWKAQSQIWSLECEGTMSAQEVKSRSGWSVSVGEDRLLISLQLKIIVTLEQMRKWVENVGLSNERTRKGLQFSLSISGMLKTSFCYKSAAYLTEFDKL